LKEFVILLFLFFLMDPIAELTCKGFERVLKGINGHAIIFIVQMGH